MPRWVKIASRWPNIAQHDAKMSQHSLQKHPQNLKTPSKVMYCRRFFDFHNFWQDHPQDPKKVAKRVPKVRQVGHLSLQVGCVAEVFRAFSLYVGSCWRSWPLSWLILTLLGPILSPNCRKITPRWPYLAQHIAKMGQDSAKMAQHSPTWRQDEPT